MEFDVCRFAYLHFFDVVRIPLLVLRMNVIFNSRTGWRGDPAVSTLVFGGDRDMDDGRMDTLTAWYKTIWSNIQSASLTCAAAPLDYLARGGGFIDARPEITPAASVLDYSVKYETPFVW